MDTTGLPVMTWNLQSLSEIFPCFTVHPLSTVLPDVLMWQIQSAVILSLQNNHSVTFNTNFNFISYGILIN